MTGVCLKSCSSNLGVKLLLRSQVDADRSPNSEKTIVFCIIHSWTKRGLQPCTKASTAILLLLNQADVDVRYATPLKTIPQLQRHHGRCTQSVEVLHSQLPCQTHHTAHKKDSAYQRNAFAPAVQQDGTCPVQHMGYSAHGSSFFLACPLLDSRQQHLGATALTDSSTGQQNWLGKSKVCQTKYVLWTVGLTQALGWILQS